MHVENKIIIILPCKASLTAFLPMRFSTCSQNMPFIFKNIGLLKEKVAKDWFTSSSRQTFIFLRTAASTHLWESATTKGKSRFFAAFLSIFTKKKKRKEITSFLSTLWFPPLTALHDARSTPLELGCRRRLTVSAGAPRSDWLGRGGSGSARRDGE